MQGPPIDMAALNDATADLMKLANGDRSVGRIAMLKLESEGEAMLEKNMTPSERAARAAKQDAHAAKLRAQRSELEAKEAAMESERRKAAANHIAGTMGIGRVAVDVGDVRSSYEYEIHFDTLELYVPLPASVTKANQLSVDVSPRQLSVGLKGERQPFLKGTFKGTVHPDDKNEIRREAVSRGSEVGVLKCKKITSTRAVLRNMFAMQRAGAAMAYVATRRRAEQHRTTRRNSEQEQEKLEEHERACGGEKGRVYGRSEL